jgi:addiction module RelB/DinJ family antitoxin
VGAMTTVLKARVDRANAVAARRVLAQLGLKPSDAINVLFAQIASRKALPFSLAIADSAYAQEEYGLDTAEVAAVGVRLRKELAKERKAGTVRSVSSVADLKG